MYIDQIPEQELQDGIVDDSGYIPELNYCIRNTTTVCGNVATTVS